MNESKRERERRGSFETGRAEFIEPVTIIRRIFVSGCARERTPDLPLTASITGRRVVWRVIRWKMPVSRANARWKSGVIMASLTLHRALPIVTRFLCEPRIIFLIFALPSRNREKTVTILFRIPGLLAIYMSAILRQRGGRLQNFGDFDDLS